MKWREYILDRVLFHPKGCWVWNGSRQGGGYGKAKFEGKQLSAHRLSYEAFVGAIPPVGFVIDHLCRRRSCVNPLHMEVVTQAENRKRGLQMDLRTPKTHCINGHAYVDSNTYKDRKGVNRCMECARQGRMRSYWRKKECLTHC